MIIGATLADHAARRPAAPAVVCDATEITWQELLRQRDRLAVLIEATSPDGKAVALQLRNCPGFMPLLLASISTGREAQIFDPDWPLAMSQPLIDQVNPGLVISHQRPAHPHLIEVPDDHPDADALIAAFGGIEEKPLPQREVSNLAPFYVGFTSGSTGLPKGYRRHHRSWLESFVVEQEEFGVSADDVLLAPGTMTHSLFLYAAAHAMQVGATLLMSRAFRPDRAIRMGQEHGATILYGVPSQLRLMAESALSSGIQLPLRLIQSSGAKLGESDHALLKRAFPQAVIAEFYGASELSFIALRKQGEGAPETSVGRPFRTVRLAIRDAQGKELATGETGLVFVESPMVFMGFATQNEASLRRHGEALSVGDVGFLDERGFLHLVGRADRMIISSGKNISPEVVEAALARHPAVKAAAVLGEPDPVRGLRLVAVVSLRAPVSASALIAHCRESLPLAMIPRHVFQTADWPMTRSGKTDFAALQRQLDGGVLERLA
ncbi:MAG: hypothetical protein BGP04_20565 [Rhizobiales bacterium 62-17]|nr:AMP-binding protein [Hyphomicrobiales bacterium]OJY00025.1 MAG: hypothetical protein BGP04_20565 [Rhizobiales bacterium 62-17]